MEGNTYLASWKKEKGHYRIWLIKDEAISFKSKSFEEAEEEVLYQILSAYGDGEAVLSFNRKLPNNLFPVEYGTPELYLVVGNEMLNPVNKTSLFTGGCCEKCGDPIGDRTEEKAIFAEPPQADGTYSDFFSAIYSKRMLDALGNISLLGGNVREVVFERKTKKRYFEVLPERCLNYVGSGKFPGFMQEVCDECGHRSFGHYYDRRTFFFCRKKDVSRDLGISFFKDHGEVLICLSGKTFRKLLNTIKLKNVAEIRVGVIPEDEVMDPYMSEEKPS